MTKAHEDLDKEFGLAEVVDTEPDNLEVIKKKPKEISISDKSEDKEKDYKYARAQLYDLVEKMQESINSAMDVAQESEHPRAYEVVFQGAKHAADVVEKIGDLHKKMKDLDVDDPKVQQTNVQNNMYVGSTAELIKMLKDSKDK